MAGYYSKTIVDCRLLIASHFATADTENRILALVLHLM
jgi:hypothetical protein